MSTERWYYIEDGVLYKHVENDGYTYARHGAEASNTLLCNVEEAEEKFPRELAMAKEKESNDAVHK